MPPWPVFWMTDGFSHRSAHPQILHFLSHMVMRKTVRLEGWKRKSSNALLGKANRCLQGAREAHRGAVAHGSCVQQQFVSGVADVWTGKGSAGSWLQVCSPGFSSPLFPALPSQCPSIIVRCLAKGLGASRQEFDGKRQTASNRTWNFQPSHLTSTLLLLQMGQAYPFFLTYQRKHVHCSAC